MLRSIKNITTVFAVTLIALLCSCVSRSDHPTVLVSDGPRPESFNNDDEFLDYIQKVHLGYMWDGAESNSGLAPERIHLDEIGTQSDSSIVTTGGSGFGTNILLDHYIY